MIMKLRSKKQKHKWRKKERVEGEGEEGEKKKERGRRREGEEREERERGEREVRGEFDIEREETGRHLLRRGRGVCSFEGYHNNALSTLRSEHVRRSFVLIARVNPIHHYPPLINHQLHTGRRPGDGCGPPMATEKQVRSAFSKFDKCTFDKCTLRAGHCVLILLYVASLSAKCMVGSPCTALPLAATTCGRFRTRARSTTFYPAWTVSSFFVFVVIPPRIGSLSRCVGEQLAPLIRCDVSQIVCCGGDE